MADRLLSEVNFDDYLGLLTSLFPAGSVFCITDLSGDTVWSHNAEALENPARIVKRLAGGGNWADAVPGQTTHDATAVATHHGAALGVEGGQSCGVLLAVIPAAQTQLDQSAQRNAVAAVANRIEPFVLGLPFFFFWYVGWALMIFLGYVITYWWEKKAAGR